MRIVLKPELLILIPEQKSDVADIENWMARHSGGVFLLRDDGAWINLRAKLRRDD